MTEAISTVQPTFVMATNNINNQPKAVRVDNIASLDTISGGIVLKDQNDRLLGRIETQSTSEDIAKKLGNVLDLQA